MKLARKTAPLAEPPRPRFFAFVADEVTRETVTRIVQQLGWRDALIGDGGVAAATEAITSASPPSLLLIDIGDAGAADDDPVAALDQLAAVCPPETKVLAIGKPNDIMLYRRLLAMGVLDYFHKPVSAEALHEAILQASRPAEPSPAAIGPAGEHAGKKPARVIAFIGARGGIGTTTLATAVGWSLSEDQQMKVALCDLDLQFGNLALGLDLEPGRGLREALEHPERIDSLLMAGAMSGRSERLRVLAAEEPLDDQPALDPAAIDPLLASLVEDFECIVVDLPRGLDGMSRRLLARADQVCIVTDLSLAGMRDAQRLAGLAALLQPQAKVRVVVNRVGAVARGEIARAEFERGLGRKIDCIIPFDAKAAAAMAEHGKALPAAASASKPAGELRRLAEQLVGRAEKPRRSLLGRLFG